MPTPSSGETEDEFVSRCIPIVLKEDDDVTQEAAAGKCHGIWDSNKSRAKRDLTLWEQGYRVEDAWYDQFGSETPYSYVTQVYSDYAIVGISSIYVKVPYTLSSDGVTFDLDSAEVVEHNWEPVRRLIARPVRAVEANGAGQYKCYGMLFGSPVKRDLYGTWFDADTNYHLDWYDTLPWLYHHGANRFIGARKVGTWLEKGIDDEGVFLVGELDTREEYADDIKYLIEEEGILFPSSGTLSYVASPPDGTGYIKDWPIAEVSSTVAPADYRQRPISQAAARAISNLGGNHE